MTAGRRIAVNGGARGWSLLESLVAIVVLGLGVMTYMRMQGRSSAMSRGNADMFKAGQLLERHVEAMRVRIAQDTTRNWPPQDTFFLDPVHAHISLETRVRRALSPKDGATLPGVRQVDITVAWGPRPLDTMRVTTYVSKIF